MEALFKNEDDLNFQSLSDQVYTHIKNLIMTGHIMGGQRIPEETIAQHFGVSRTPIREALRKLEKNGLIRLHPRKYAEVVKVTSEDKVYVGQLRVQLDSLSVRLLAEKCSEDDYETLKDIAILCNSLADKGDFAGCFEMDSLYHRTIAERSGNPYLFEIVKNLDHKVQLMRNIEKISVPRVKEGIKLHLPIVEALNSHKAMLAEQLIIEHLQKYYFSEDE